QHRIDKVSYEGTLVRLKSFDGMDEPFQGKDPKFVTLPDEVRRRLIDYHDSPNVLLAEKFQIFEDYHRTHRPSYEYRMLDVARLKERSQILRIGRYCVAAQHLVGITMTAEVRRQHAVVSREIQDLILEELATHHHSMQKDNRHARSRVLQGIA